MNIDPVGIIERAHEASATLAGPEAWLERIGELVLPALCPSWLGGLAILAEPPPPEPIVIPMSPSNRAPDALDADAIEAVLRAAMTSASKDHRAATERALERPGLTSLMQAVGSLPPWTSQASPVPIADVLVLSLRSRNGRLAAFAIAIAEPMRIDDVTHRLWHRLAIHLGSALSQLGVPAAVADEPSREGHSGRRQVLVDHPRDELRRAVVHVARNQTHAPDPSEALELWRGLLTGRWSLVDHFDDEGRRYVLARQNPEHDRSHRLSRRQHQVAFHAALGSSNKEIGFSLGLAENTVSAHLTRAMQKMGIRSRTDLVRLSTQVTVGAEPRVA